MTWKGSFLFQTRRVSAIKLGLVDLLAENSAIHLSLEEYNGGSAKLGEQSLHLRKPDHGTR